MLVLKIAWRNILRHKGKSLVIGLILVMGAFLMVLGNASANGMQRGIDENMVKSFSGHIILVSDEEPKDNVLFTPMAKPLKIMKDYEKVSEVLKQQNYIKDFIPMTRGGIALLGGSQMSLLLTFGCNFDDYQRVFGNSIIAEEGELLKNGGKGMLVNVNGRNKLFDEQGFWLVPEGGKVIEANLNEDAKKEYPDFETKHSLSLTAFGESNATDMEVPIRGIIKFKSLNAAFQEVTMMDIETYRTLFGYFSAEEVVEEIPVAQKELLASDEDDLFGDGSIFTDSAATLSQSEVEKSLKTKKVVTTKINFDNAAYNYVSILLQPGEDLSASVAKMKQLMKDNNLPVKVLDWRTASGSVANMADMVSIFFSIFVFLLFFVAAIIITNTLSMTAMDRVSELGMMRAVGARRGFILRMFVVETFILASIFCTIGILLGSIAMWIIRGIGIGSGGVDIVELFFGGEVFQPVLGFQGLVSGIGFLTIVIALSLILPVILAWKITPLDAINRQ